jgi:antagonist of KipI
MLKVLDPGILTTVQDAGRWGHQAYGLPVSGAMDWFALRAANQLVGNSPDEAALEIHSPVVLQTDAPHLLVLTGANARFEINGRAMPQWMSIFVRAGATIEIAPKRAGGWIYLAGHGGIDVPRILGSKSTFLRGKLGGLKGHALMTGDEICFGPGRTGDLVVAAGRGASEPVLAFAKRTPEVRVVLGPHNDLFAPDAFATLTQSEYVVTENADRMGYRLVGNPLLRHACTESEEMIELVSCGAPLGAIQVLPDGQPIVLMADRQPTGGYPIIATAITSDIPLIAQCVARDYLRFKVISIDEAQYAWMQARDLFTKKR